MMSHDVSWLVWQLCDKTYQDLMSGVCMICISLVGVVLIFNLDDLWYSMVLCRIGQEIKLMCSNEAAVVAIVIIILILILHSARFPIPNINCEAYKWPMRKLTKHSGAGHLCRVLWQLLAWIWRTRLRNLVCQKAWAEKTGKGNCKL